MSKRVTTNIYRVCVISFLFFACYMLNNTKIYAKEEGGLLLSASGPCMQCKVVSQSGITEDEEVFAYNYLEETDSYEITAVLKEKEELVIPDTYQGKAVTGIASYAFSSCKILTGASISANCEKISEGAFQNCSNLTEVTLRKGLITIGDSAFQNCVSLKRIKLPEGTKSIGKSAFAGCGKLYQIEIPSSVKKIGTSVASKKSFKGCNFSILTFVTPEGSAAQKYAKEEYMEKYQRGILTSTTTVQKIDAKSSYMYEGEARNLNIYNYGGTKISMKSSNSKVVSVSSYGILKAKKSGKAKITVKLDNTTYTYTFHVLKKTKNNVLKVIKQVYVTPDMPDYQKVVAVNEWLARNVAYDKRYYQGLQYLPYKSYTVQGALEKGVAVSEGYAYAFMEIMDMYGISSKKVNGYVKTYSKYQGHAWNLVYIGGKWYHVDCALNDPVSVKKNGKIDNTNKKAESFYLIEKDSFMGKDHRWNKKIYPKAKTSSISKTVTTIKGTNGAYLNKTSATISVGKTVIFKVGGTKKKVTWKSSNKAVATVNAKGKVTGKKAGKAKVTVSVAGKKYICNICVR